MFLTIEPGVYGGYQIKIKNGKLIDNENPIDRYMPVCGGGGLIVYTYLVQLSRPTYPDTTRNADGPGGKVYYAKNEWDKNVLKEKVFPILF